MANCALDPQYQCADEVMDSDRPVPPTNRLRQHYLQQQQTKPPRRLQRDIVRDYRAEIIGLIRDDGATIDDVVATVIAEGEPVLDDGFRAQIRIQIGTVKAIRSGQIITTMDGGELGGVARPSTAPPETPVSDLDEDFVGRRSRT